MPARCLLFLLLGLLLQLEPACCQQARGNLQPWSQGVIAVAVFLVLVAIAFVVNRFWCKEKVCEHKPSVPAAPCTGAPPNRPLGCYRKKDGENIETVVSVEDKQEAVMSNGHEGRYITTAADFRSKESQHAYENTVEPEERVITTAM